MHKEVEHIIPRGDIRQITQQASEVFNGGNGLGKINLNLKSSIIFRTPYHPNREGNHNKFNQINQRTTIT